MIFTDNIEDLNGVENGICVLSDKEYDDLFISNFELFDKYDIISQYDKSFMNNVSSEYLVNYYICTLLINRNVKFRRIEFTKSINRDKPNMIGNYIITFVKPNISTRKLKEFLFNLSEEYPDQQKIVIFQHDDYVVNVSKNIFGNYDKYTYFDELSLMFDPTTAKIVPKHEKISNEELEEVLDKYDDKDNIKFPILLSTDIISKWYGYKANDVIKITRNMGINEVVYRRVKHPF